MPKDRGRVFSRWALFLVAFYRVFLSGWLGGNCRFYPSCSQYAEEALATFPFFRALGLIGRRLGRCRPGGPHGYDPLPLPSGKPPQP